MSYRLLKVLCQAVLVSEDEDGNLFEHLTEPVTVTAKDWPGYPARMLLQMAAMTNGKDPTMTDTPTEPAPDPEPEPAPEPEVFDQDADWPEGRPEPVEASHGEHTPE